MRSKILAATLLLLSTVASYAQGGYTAIKGKCTDENGQIIANAEIQMVGVENGRKYNIKVNGKGEYYAIGIQSDQYRIALVKEGKELFFLNKYPISLAEEVNVVDFDLKKERATAVKEGKVPQLTEEQKKMIAEAEKENASVRNLNEMISAARAARNAGNTESAIGILKKALDLDSTKALIWFHMGESQSAAAKQQTDRASRADYFTQASQSYQKAVDLASVSSDQNEKKYVPSFQNNLGKALEGAGKVEEAGTAFAAAAAGATNPKESAQYYFNAGAMYSNNFRVDDAIKAYDKAIAADPDKADAYYQKGISLVGKATLGKDGSVQAPPGTAESLNKYLELMPEGPYAQQAKEMLAAIGAKVETTFKSGKKKN
ncbi:MAG: tetratricopeptide repeat protein [Acidobacteriales bacterium]|nr:tetratricopeptide repeat protein [Terriglobales bacterium]